ncbi:putative transmembrane protein, partial [Rhizoctonia solani 123E]
KELDTDGTIWQVYQEESREYDKELVENRDKSLDVLLIYAGLFSSVLAGFLLESKNLLQQDTATVSMHLLFYIAQSQNRTENSRLQPSLPTEIAQFTASDAARWINALWFLALVLSLTTALIAMLAKEWLHAYISSQPTEPHANALLHQARLHQMQKWHALEIVDLLPTALHLALLLFFVGLVIYLRELDSLVSHLVAAFSGAAFLFYMATTLFASLVRFCPFVTQVSKFL